MIKIRTAEEQDAARISELLRQICLVHHNGRPDLFTTDKKYSDAQVLEMIRNGERPIFVAVDKQNQLLGYALCELKHYGSNGALNNIQTLYLDDLCVDEHYRGRHIGTALYHAVVDYARQIGCYNLTLNVWSFNESAISFYESCGLKPQKTTLEKIL